MIARRWLLLMLCVAALSVARGLNAQQPGSAGAIAGTIRDTTGAPLADVTVTLSEPRRSATTDEQGGFQISGLAPGEYVLEARRIGYVRIEQRVRVARGQTRRVEITMIIRPVMVDQVVVLGRAAGLRGVVHDVSRTPIAGAEVWLSNRSQPVRTGRDGRFRLGAGAGTYLVRVAAPGYAPRIFSVLIPEGEGRDVSVILRASDRGRSNMDRMAWEDFSMRRRWAGATASFLPRERLTGSRVLRLSDHPVVVQDAGNSPCVWVDGRPSVLPIEYFFLEDVEAVEVLPPGSLPGSRRERNLPSMGRATGGAAASPSPACSAVVVVWLRSD